MCLSFEEGGKTQESGAVDENDTLQFVGQEEGRIRFKADNNTLHYDYFIKDHLGNVRMVLTEEVQTVAYTAATLEPATITAESAYYGNLSAMQYSKPAWFTDPVYTTNTKVAQVKNASGVQKVGPNILLKVMAGDSYNIRVASGWNGGSATNNSTNVLTDLFSLLSSGLAGASGGKATLSELQAGSSGLNSGLSSFLNTQTTSGSKPKAYINWILFDEQFKIVSGSSGFEQVGASGSATIHTRTGLTIPKSGYLYIYTSNEATNIDVFFDNLQVTHYRGPLTEEAHYYPFGLTMAGISSKAAGGIENRYKFNKGTELNSDFGISLYETDCRLYDPQIGRFWQIDEIAESNWEWSAYTFALDNPIEFNDPLGLDPEKGLTEKTAVTLPGVTVVAIPKSFYGQERLYYKILYALRSSGKSIEDLEQPSLIQMMKRVREVKDVFVRAAEIQREFDEAALEFGSLFVPMGWLTKAKYAKYAWRLFRLKRGVTAFKALKYASEYGIKGYRKLKKLSPLGSEVHHLIEKRFANLFGVAEKDMASIVVTETEHQVFTNAWRAEIGYEGSKSTITTLSATRADVEAAARRIYADFPEILKALGL